MDILKTIFLPYTIFHLASLARSLSGGMQLNGELYIVEGLGEFKNDLKSIFYMKVLEKIISHQPNAPVIHFVNIAKINGILFMVKARFIKYKFITGNLRRTPSLYFSKHSSCLEIVDDGIGTTLKENYFDSTVSEQSTLKKILIKIRLIDSYKLATNKIVNHFTIFSNSVYEKLIPIPFEIQGLSPSVPLNFFPRKLTIFVSSSLVSFGVLSYCSKVRKYIKEFNKNNTSIYYASHPTDSKKDTEYIISYFGFQNIDLKNLLLEDFVLEVVKSGREVTLIGEENTTTSILREIKPEGVHIETKWIGKLS